MLTEAQQKYLLTIPLDKIATILPFSPKLEATAADLMSAVQKIVPDLEVRHMGAAALGLSGQGDIDIYIFCQQNVFEHHLPALVQTFGKPTHQSENSITWAFEKNDFPVEIYLTDPSSPAMQEQINMFELLRDNADLRKKYETLKDGMNGRSFREYQTAKYEFYNKALSIE